MKGLTLITFGAGYGAGYLSGLALMSSTQLTSTSIKALGAVAGALAGSGVRTGAYFIINEIEGKKFEVLTLVLEG